MIAALGDINGSASDNLLGFVGLVVVVAVIPVHLWRQRRRRIRQTALRAQVAEALRLMGQGRYTKAEQRWLAVQAQCRPKQSGDQAIMLLAGWQMAVGRVARGLLAEADFSALLASYGPERYPDRRDAWLAAAGFAGTLVARGRHADGIALARRVADECQRRWGAESQTTLTARSQLGWCLTEGNRPADAVSVLTDVLAINNRIHGSTEMRTQARHNLAEANLLLGRLDEAEREFRAVLAEYEGREESRVSSSGARFGLAKIAAMRGHREEAAEGFTEVLAELRTMVGEDGPWTLETLFELANLKAHDANPSEALLEHEAVLAARTRVLGPDHPDTAASRTAVIECGG